VFFCVVVVVGREEVVGEKRRDRPKTNKQDNSSVLVSDVLSHAANTNRRLPLLMSKKKKNLPADSGGWQRLPPRSVMGSRQSGGFLRHSGMFSVEGVQFHPESVCYDR